MIPLSIHKKIILTAIDYVLIEPEHGESHIGQYLQLKKLAKTEPLSEARSRAYNACTCEVAEAYETTPEEFLYREIGAWRDAILTGYKLATSITDPIIRDLNYGLTQWAELANEDEHRDSDIEAIQAANAYLNE